MELTYACSKCGSVGRVAPLEGISSTVCPRCGEIRSLIPAAIRNGELQECAACGTEHLYTQKDFPQALGLAIVIVGFVVSSIFWYFDRPLVTYGILLASALLDMVLYYKVPNVIICYRCLSQYRSAGANLGGRFVPFDLAIGERYRQERIRVEDHRQRERNAARKPSDLGRPDFQPSPTPSGENES